MGSVLVPMFAPDQPALYVLLAVMSLAFVILGEMSFKYPVQVFGSPEVRQLFHWKNASWFIAISWGSALGMTSIALALPQYEIPIWPIIWMAYALTVAAFLWTVGYCLTSDRSNRKRALCFGTFLLFVFFVCCIHSVQYEIERHIGVGLLTPASDDVPVNHCGSTERGGISLYWGGNISYITAFPHVVIKVKGQDLLVINRDSKGRLSLTAEIFDHSGNLVAEIHNNIFRINKLNYFEFDHPDNSTLWVRDQRGKEVLNIRYQDPESVRITAMIYAEDGELIHITKDKVLLPNGGLTIFNSPCLSHVFGGDIVLN
jgi:hypothetical protein